jgi:dynein heavy chain
MGVAGSGRNTVDPRFMSLFSVYNMSFPSDGTIIHIYKSILEGHTKIFGEEIREVVPKIIEATLHLYKVFY